MHLTSFEAEHLRQRVIDAAEREGVDLDSLPGWDLNIGWPNESRGKLWRVEPMNCVALDTISRTPEDNRTLCRGLSARFDPKLELPWVLVPGRNYGEVWIVWPPDEAPLPLS